MFKILIAEDEAFMRRMLAMKLKKAGYETIEAVDGEEALTKLKDGCDLVLLDIAMPEMDGFEVMEAMQKDGKMKKILVIVLSNLGQEEDIKKGKALGAKDYVVKTDISLSEVVEKVKKYLK